MDPVWQLRGDHLIQIGLKIGLWINRVILLSKYHYSLSLLQKLSHLAPLGKGSIKKTFKVMEFSISSQLYVSFVQFLYSSLFLEIFLLHIKSVILKF